MVSEHENRFSLDFIFRRGSAASVIACFYFFFAATIAAGEPIGKYGKLLDAFLEEQHVEQYWIAGRKVDWKTGVATVPDENLPNNRSHCSAFVAAVCFRLGIYILQPPEHGLQFLAKAQGVWLQKHGSEKGWFDVASAQEAQALANRGLMVIASYRQAAPGNRGHIAIVKPSTKNGRLIDREGPDIIQAGKVNYSLTSLSIGFQSFEQAFKKNKVRYFAHYIPHKNWRNYSRSNAPP